MFFDAECSDVTYREVSTHSEIEPAIVVKVSGNDQVGKHTVRQYNHDIAEYALAIAGGGTPAAIRQMLIIPQAGASSGTQANFTSFLLVTAKSILPSELKSPAAMPASLRKSCNTMDLTEKVPSPEPSITDIVPESPLQRLAMSQ